MKRTAREQGKWKWNGNGMGKETERDGNRAFLYIICFITPPLLPTRLQENASITGVVCMYMYVASLTDFFHSFKQKTGRTALMIAVIEGHKHIIQRLVSAGADVLIKDKVCGFMYVSYVTYKKTSGQ